MKFIKSTITALGLLFTVTACAGNKESKNQNMKGENMEIVHLTKAEFLKKVYNYEANPNDWKYEGDKPAIVDFYADWCGPCKMVAPILDELAKEYDGQIVIYKVDTEKEIGRVCVQLASPDFKYMSGETLTLEEFARLSDLLSPYKKG